MLGVVLVSLLAIAPFGWSSSLEQEVNAPKQPSYLIVTSRQRSSSTTLSRVLASHPCALDGNEIWFEKSTQDKLGAHNYTGMGWKAVHTEPHLFLTSARAKICAKALSDGTIPDTCGGQCTIVIKMFDQHGLKRDVISSLMADPSMAFVVLERDVGGEYCSHQRAELHHDWGTLPGKHKTGLPLLDCAEVPEKYVNVHNDWFHFVRRALGLHGRIFVDVSFDLVASCGLQGLAESIYAMHGFVLPTTLNVAEEIDALFRGCA